MKTLTIDQLFTMTWKKHWAQARYFDSGWANEVDRLYRNRIYPLFGEKPFTKISVKELRDWHSTAATDHPVSANRALEVLSKLFSFADESNLGEPGFNPCKSVKAAKEQKRKRSASSDEIKAIAELLDRESMFYPVQCAFIFTLMYSGARPRSIERARWEDIEIMSHKGQSFGVMTFNGKSSAETGEEEQVIIPPQALELLGEVKTKGPVFGIKTPRSLWEKIREEIGCEGLWIRDLRRTFAIVGLSNGVSAGIVGELLNHKSAQTTKRYSGLLQDKRLEAAGVVADAMTKIIGKQK